MVRGRHFSTLLLVVGLLGSLGAKKPRRAYLQTYEAHTQHLVVYREFSTALDLRATLLDRGMREALAQERSRLLGSAVDEDDGEAFEARTKRDLEGYHEVVFSAQSGFPDADRFGTTDAHWNLRLEADGVEQPLVTVEHIRRPTPLHRGLYPHVTQWSELWIARFERRSTSPRELELSVGSGLGHGSITWTAN